MHERDAHATEGNCYGSPSPIVMISPREIFFGIILPAVFALLAVLADVRPWQRDRGGGRGAWSLAVASAVAFLLAFFGRDRLPSFPPVEAEGWIFYCGAAAAVVAVALSLTRAKIWIGAIAALVFAGAIVALMLWPQVKQRAMEPGLFWSWTIGLAVAGAMWWVLMEMLTSRVRGGSVPFFLSIVVGGAALVLVNADSQRLGQFAGAVGVALLVASLIAFWGRDASFARGPLLVVLVLMLGMFVSGKFFASMTIGEMFVLAAAPLAMWVGEVRAVRKRGWTRFAVAGVCVLIVLSIALAPAIMGLRQTMKEQTSYESYY
jgi:hypothetical protein